ncbi:hypothetical protein ACIBQ3_05800 [Streptomyces rubiginosohelvolus]|uniref:hypothetical protein n=1 Tax=Streptomyces rubiginosohelvolus TaxID=67362 RepID=UPI0037A408CC
MQGLRHVQGIRDVRTLRHIRVEQQRRLLRLPGREHGRQPGTTEGIRGRVKRQAPNSSSTPGRSEGLLVRQRSIS